MIVAIVIIVVYLKKKRKLCFSSIRHKDTKGRLSPRHEISGESVHCEPCVGLLRAEVSCDTA